MTKLFIRFYISVIVILIIGLCIMAFARRFRIDADFDSITERVTRGGVRLAKEAIESKTENGVSAAIRKLEDELNYPIRITSDDQFQEIFWELLSKEEDVLVHVDNELSVLIPLKNGTRSIRLGPVPIRHGHIELDMIVAMGGVLLLVAIAIVFLLRPLASQLGVLEQTATSIAEGNLGARVDLKSIDSAQTLARAFNDMAARVEALLRMQRELLQAVSHELRTPLSRINFGIDLIRTSKDENEREYRLDSLETAAQDLDDLVDELLRYVRLETSGPQHGGENIELLPLVEELMGKFSLLFGSKKFEMGAEIRRGNINIVADRIGLARVLSNLLSNAGKFGRNIIVVDATVSSAGIEIDVDDDGPGIPESDRERVFEPFTRLEENTHGVGLGLALVKRIVANHGGSVTALQSPLGGCRMRSLWPMKQ